jgi:hypothetical protein
MVKTYQNLQLLARDSVHELSILESRKHNQAVVFRTAEDYNLDLLQNGSACAVKTSSSKRGLRKILFIDKWYELVGNKGQFREYGTEARGLDLSPFYNHPSMRPSWTSADALSIAPRRRH